VVVVVPSLDAHSWVCFDQIDCDASTLAALEAALLELANDQCLDAASDHTVLHRLVAYRAKRAVSAAHAVRMASAIIRKNPSLLTVQDSEGQDPATAAMCAPHCGKLAELFCECVATNFFDRYVPPVAVVLRVPDSPQSCVPLRLAPTCCLAGTSFPTRCTRY
jgi:hypothetical protein